MPIAILCLERLLHSVASTILNFYLQISGICIVLLFVCFYRRFTITWLTIPYKSGRSTRQMMGEIHSLFCFADKSSPRTKSTCLVSAENTTFNCVFSHLLYSSIATFPSSVLEVSDHEVKEWLSPKDFTIGKAVNIMGRRFLM